MSVDLFRQQAVRATSDPDDRGGLLQARPPSGWLPLAVLAALLVGAVVVAVVARVQSAATGRGELRNEPRSISVRAPAAGVVQKIARQAGDLVAVGDALITTDGAPIVASITAHVEAMEAAVGESLRAGDLVARLTPASATLVGRLTLPARERSRVRVGDPVRLELDEYPADEMGAASGRIARVLDGSEPASFVAEVALEQMPAGVESPFRAGMTFTGRVALHEERIITVLFPGLRRLLPLP